MFKILILLSIKQSHFLFSSCPSFGTMAILFSFYNGHSGYSGHNGHDGHSEISFSQANCKTCLSNLPTNVYHRFCQLAKFSDSTSSIPWKNGDASGTPSGHHQHHVESCRNVSNDIRNLWTNVVDYHMSDNGEISLCVKFAVKIAIYQINFFSLF